MHSTLKKAQIVQMFHVEVLDTLCAMSRSDWKSVFSWVARFFFFVLILDALCDIYANYRQYPGL